MEHPLIGNLDQLTADELSGKVNELNNNLNIAMRSGNGHMCNQLRMAIETYQNKYQEVVQQTYKKQTINNIQAHKEYTHVIKI